MNVFSLELAIYFILPPLVLFTASYASADIFNLVAQLMVERDIKRDTGVTAMAILIAATTTVTLMTYWMTQQASAAIIAAPIAFFGTGGFTCARLVLDYSQNGKKHRFGPIGLGKGFKISALLSSCTIIPLAIVTWIATQTR